MKLLSISENFIKDDSKWVKNSIYSEFGKFIYQISLYNQGDFSKHIDKLIEDYVEELKNEDLDKLDVKNA